MILTMQEEKTLTALNQMLAGEALGQIKKMKRHKTPRPKSSPKSSKTRKHDQISCYNKQANWWAHGNTMKWGRATMVLYREVITSRLLAFL